jgi:hypothetical protein
MGNTTALHISRATVGNNLSQTDQRKKRLRPASFKPALRQAATMKYKWRKSDPQHEIGMAWTYIAALGKHL